MSVLETGAKVFGIGLNKTGTTSLGVALGRLGVVTADYPMDATTLRQLESGDFRLKVLETHQGVTDTPVSPYYAELDALYPGSRFILTVRDKAKWLSSAEAHWKRQREWASHHEAFARFTYFNTAVVYGCVEFNAARFARVFDLHRQNVEAYFADRPEDLLVMDITAGDGWQKLCPFLGLDVPDIPFPTANRKERGMSWLEQFQAVLGDLSAHVPEGSRLILIDEDEFAGSTIHRRWRCSPLPESDGVYAGKPRDSAHAIAEFERRRGDADFLAVTAPAMWWLDHYTEFADHLAGCSSVVRHERLALYDLR